MCGRTNGFLVEQANRVADVPDAATQAGVVTTMYAAISGARGGTAKRTRELTKAARTARKQIMELVPGLLGPLTRVATKLGDTTVLASATLTQEQLRALRPLALLGILDGLLATAAQPAVADNLVTGYKLTAKKLQPLRDAVEAFRGAQPQPRKTIDERVRAGEKLEGLVDSLMKEVRDLDEDMKAFVLLDGELYGDYLQVRKIIDTGSRPCDDGDGGDGGPAAE